MLQAIETRYVGPSNKLGSRIIACANPGRRVFNYDYELTADQNHVEAARRYAYEFRWFGDWRGGGTRKGYAFVCADNSGDLPDFVV